MSLYVSALYPPEGGPCLGFSCRYVIHWTEEMGENVRPKYPHECGHLSKTEQGAYLHLASVHGILRQPFMEFYASQKSEHPSDGTKVPLDRASEDVTLHLSETSDNKEK